MKLGNIFSFRRFRAVISKEFVQMRRDRMTFAMMIGIPIVQMVGFGFAINSDPKHLPTVMLTADHSVYSRSVVSAMRNSGYFQIVKTVAGEAEADQLIAEGEAQFVVSIPEGFSRRLVRGERPALLLTADATDPSATSNALSAFRVFVETALARDLDGSLRHLRRSGPPVDIIVHARFNPEGITQYNIVPGLMFPFRGMPLWAQRIGEMLPLTHYLRIVRGIVLKGNSIPQILPNLWPIGLFLLVALSIGLTRYRRTLD